MGNAKSLVLVITSLTFLVSGAICSQLFVHPVFAAPPDPCFGKHSAGCPGMECINSPENLAAYCCWTDIQDGERVCQACGVNTDTGEFENCTIVSSEGKLDTSTVAPPPSGVAPPPPPGPGKGGPGNVLPEGVFEGPTTSPEQGGMTPEVAPPTEPEGDDETQSRFTSPTGGCIPFIETQCIPCDPGLPGADCILEDDWETTIGTTAARGAVACGPPPMPACGPHSPPPPPPPTNHVVKGPQGGEKEQPPAPEEAQPATVEEEQPVPVCQEGLEFNENLGFCVPENCPEGQVLDEGSGICVLEEPEVVEEVPEQSQVEEPEQSEPEQPEQQSSDGGGNSGDNSNNDDGNNN